MKLRFCVICGTNKDLQHHHITPTSQGGDDHQHNFLTLCFEHHNFIHNIRRTRSKENFVSCIKAGQINGVGGRPKLDISKEKEVVKLYLEGHSYRAIKRMTGVALSTIRRIITDNNLPSRL
jgi:DNA invertase Pin-like site-specific DNA recombinase